MNAVMRDISGEKASGGVSGRSFATKKAMFVDGTILSHLEMSILDLKEIEVTCETRYLEPVLFERAVALGSPVVAAAKSVFVGAYSYMNSGGYIRDRVIIGRYCSIGRRVTIGAGMHNMSGLSTSPFLRAARSANASVPYTTISHDVWIGDGVVIMPGISVGTGAVIGANAVVTRDVPDYSIVAGVPARQIGMRFEPKIVQRLIGSDFWEFPREHLNSIVAKGVEELLDRMEVSNTQSLESSFATYSLRAVTCL